MKQRVFAIMAVAVLLVSLLGACKKDDGVIDQEEALQIVLEETGLTEAQAHPHVHVATIEGVACWNVYVTVGGKQMQYVVHGITGEILSVGESTHTH